MLLRRLEGKPVVDRCTCVKPVGEGSFVSKGQLGRVFLYELSRVSSHPFGRFDLQIALLDDRDRDRSSEGGVRVVRVRDG